jgi:hypothetical protein
MPDFTYAGPGGRIYPESRDSEGEMVGAVEPGDTRDLDEAIDQFWFPVAPPKGAKAAAVTTTPAGDGQKAEG